MGCPSVEHKWSPLGSGLSSSLGYAKASTANKCHPKRSGEQLLRTLPYARSVHLLWMTIFSSLLSRLTQKVIPNTCQPHPSPMYHCAQQWTKPRTLITEPIYYLQFVKIHLKFSFAFPKNLSSDWERHCFPHLKRTQETGLC